MRAFTDVRRISKSGEWGRQNGYAPQCSVPGIGAYLRVKQVNRFYYDRKMRPCSSVTVAEGFSRISGQLLVNEGRELGLAQGSNFGGSQLPVLE